MEQEMKNKIAVITGGARGIGFAIAEEILKEGAKTVIIIDLNEIQGPETVKQLNSKYGKDKAAFIRADVTKDLDRVSEVILDQYKYVDILVNSAGIADENDVDKIFAINSIATAKWSTKFYQQMRKDMGGYGGTILNISSIYGYVIDPFLPIYKATKFAVVGFTKTLGHVKNYEVTGVRVVVICPGGTETDMISEAKPYDSLYILSSDYKEQQPMQEAKDAAKAAIEVITKVVTGSAWNIIGGKPIQEV